MQIQRFPTIGEWTEKKTNSFIEEKLIIRNPEELKSKIEKMISEGAKQMQIVTDFDQTISSFLSPATFSLFRMSELSPQDFKNKMQSYYDYYVPIEKDQSIKIEEKNKHMHEWYQKVSEAFHEAKFTKSLSCQILNTSHIYLRYLFEPFFNKCVEEHVPFHIVSGGLDRVINTILSSIHEIDTYDEMTLHTNQMLFQDDTLEKMEMLVTATTKAKILETSGIQFRNNTILLGDLPSDFYMTKFLNIPNQVSIGFLAQDHAYQLEEYKKLYDITIIGDPSFLVPLVLLSKVMGYPLSEEQTQLFNSKNYDELRKLF
ncbi:unnamed protein product [Paramecium pentaurelia]|uniref:5'-nucleotidase n=1 Tax=Paramecium pentaurelia TaxID=43138 RepID=A0A8S1TJ26_9CILI|nr:unnamed protein product [Paramecium pentaurelia]